MSADVQAIRALVGRWHAATSAADIDTVLSLMAEDVVFLVGGQPPMRGRATFERALRTLLTTHRIDSNSDIQDVQVSGDMAYCWTALTVFITPRAGGTAATRTGHGLSVLKREADGRWVVIRDANLLGPSRAAG